MCIYTEVNYRQHISKPNFFFNIISLYFLFGEFNPVTFRLVIDKYGHIQSFKFLLIVLSILCSFLLVHLCGLEIKENVMLLLQHIPKRVIFSFVH
jgi:hypothetical protein